MSKFCPKCKTNKETSEFSLAKRRDGFRSWCRDCEKVRGKANSLALRNQVFHKLGDLCQRCDFSDRRALQIDHVNGGGNKEHQELKSNISFLKKVLADQTGMYQILCANCNWIKRSERKEVVTEYNLSEEGRQKLVSCRTNWVPSNETRQKMSDSHKGQSPSEEHKEKLRQQSKDNWADPEIRKRRMSAQKAAFAARAALKRVA